MARLLTTLTLLITAAAIVLLVIGRDAVFPDDAWGVRGGLIVVPLLIAPVGGLVALRRPENPVGWLLLVSAFLFSVVVLTQEWATNAVGGGVDLPGGAWAAWYTVWGWVPPTFLMGVHALLLFPDGQYTSRRWRRVGAVATVSLVAIVAVNALADSPAEGYGTPTPVGLLPISIEEANSAYGWMTILLVAAQASLIGRVRRSDGDEREQVRWVLLAAGVVLVTFVINVVLQYGIDAEIPALAQSIAEATVPLALTLIPLAAGVAILKYRLYDIDVVISRALVVAGLTAFGTVVYLAIALGLGALLGRGGASVAATAVIALMFQPVRARLELFAQRVVYGERATPYDVLADVARSLSVDRLAANLCQATAADRVVVWLRVRSELRPEASSPAGIDLAPVADIGDLSASCVEPVLHEGELLGAITVDARRGEVLSDVDVRLVKDVAAQAGVALRNVRLTAELMQRVEELRESRQRLVSAQDEERRRLERDLHDGAQQQLVALRVRLNIAKSIAESEHATETAQQLGELSTSLGEAVDTLRELAHGIYPPRLAADGLVGALTSQAMKSHLHVEVAGEVGRYDKTIEAAVYFCCLEALQNAAKYAEPSSVRVGLAEQNGHLVFTVADDGRGFDPDSMTAGAGTQNMLDRIDALGGSVRIDSTPGQGTTVEGRLPVPTVAGGDRADAIS